MRRRVTAFGLSSQQETFLAVNAKLPFILPPQERIRFLVHFLRLGSPNRWSPNCGCILQNRETLWSIIVARRFDSWIELNHPSLLVDVFDKRYRALICWYPAVFPSSDIKCPCCVHIITKIQPIQFSPDNFDIGAASFLQRLPPFRRCNWLVLTAYRRNPIEQTPFALFQALIKT